MHAVAYRSTGFSEIDLIRPLWEQLNGHHRERARVFRAVYERMTFADRRSYFDTLRSSGEFRLDLATDTATGKYVGYCVSSVSSDLIGEVESLFVEDGYRSEGIGTVLVTRGMGWMDSLGAVRKRVSVGNGNEAAFPFYRKFGFFPRMTILEQAEEPGSEPSRYRTGAGNP